MKTEKMYSDTPKILILAVHGPYEPWLSILEKGQLPTWMKHSNIQVINVFGKKMSPRKQKLDQKIYFLRWNKLASISYLSLAIEGALKKTFFINRWLPKIISSTDSVYGEKMEIQMPDSLLLQGVKNMAAIRHSLAFDYDYLITTITSSYLNTHCIVNTLRNTPREFYLGGRIELSGGVNFQQGSFRVFSRDVVRFVNENAHLYKHWQIEDIAMGNLVRKYTPNFFELRNLTITSLEDAKNLSSELVRNTCSLRCKSTMSDGTRMDSLIMLELHEKLTP